MESMLMGQEAERNRIGKELHDSLGATLSTIKLQMSSSPGNDHPEGHSMKKAKEMIDEACEEVRKISRDMMPITLTKYGLHTALEELIDKYNFEGGPNVIYQAFGIIQHDNKDLDLFTYRIIQELVNNCIKHAQAQEIIVQINYLEGLMIITVEDDGNGFDFENTQYQGMGLKNVEYRAQYLKGKFSVESSPGVGTIMVVEIPINKKSSTQSVKLFYLILHTLFFLLTHTISLHLVSIILDLSINNKLRLISIKNYFFNPIVSTIKLILVNLFGIQIIFGIIIIFLNL
jgi:two-component system NarL family sensor kinase